MKRFLRVLVLMAACVLLMGLCVAQAEAAVVTDSGTCGDNLTWTLDSDGVLTISGTGAMTNYTFDTKAPWYPSRTLIQTVIVESGVNNIGDYAFYQASGLKMLNLPTTLLKLGKSAFFKCVSLEAIALPNTILQIGYECFSGCSNLSSINIPTSLTACHSGPGYEGRIFQNCTSLTSIVVPNEMEKLPSYAFDGCNFIKSVTLPDSLTSISSYTFRDCKSLVNIVIPDSVTTIQRSAFSNCTNLNKINIPNSVTELGAWAFFGCSSLETIELPDSISHLGFRCFAGCTSLSHINIPTGWTDCPSYNNYGGVDNQGQIFQGCTNLTSVTVPNGITRLPPYAFSCCDTLISINLPSSLTVISKFAFNGCKALININIPATITIFPRNTFSECSSLKEIIIPSSVIELGACAFAGCSSLKTVDLPNTITDIGWRCFFNCINLTSINIPTSWTNCPSYTWAYGPGFQGQIFSGCTNLKSINVPKEMITLPAYAFSGCDSISSIVLPGSLTAISEYSLYNCDALVYVEIPPGVSYIGNNAFARCPKLNRIIFLGSAPLLEDMSGACFTEGVTLHYVNGKGGWSTPTWNGYACYPILETGDISISDADYYSTPFSRQFYFVDSNGAPLDQVSMNYDGGSVSSGDHSTITTKLSGNGEVVFTRSGYRSVSLPMSVLSIHNRIRFWPDTYSEPFAPAVYARHQGTGSYTDLLENTMIFHAGSLTETTAFYIDADWNGKTAGKIYLSPTLQPSDGVEVKEGFNAAQNISTSLEANGTLYLLLVDSSETVCVQKLNAVIQKEKVTVDVDLGESIDIPTPNDDFFNKFKFKIDLLDKLDASMTISDDGTVKIALGVEVEKEEDTERIVKSIQDALLWSETKESLGGGGIKNLGKQIDALQNQLKKHGAQIVPRSSSVVIQGETQAIGYAIGKITKQADGSLGILFLECKVAVKIESSELATWQLYAWGAPFYVGGEIKLGLETGLTLFRIGTDGGLLPEPIDIETQLGLKVRGGLGWDSIASAGIYGRGALTLKTKFPVAGEDLFVYANAAFGAEAKFFCFSADLEIYKTKDFYLYPWNYKPSTKSAYMSLQSVSMDSDWQPQSRDYLNAQPSRPVLYSVSGADTVLDTSTVSESVYPYGDVQTVALPDGRQLAVWTEDPGVAARAAANNRTRLYFSFWDGASWSAPAPVEAADDGTADFAPVLKVLDGTAYLFWQDASRALTDSDDAASTAAVMNYSIAKFDGSKFVGLGTVGTDNYDGAADLTLLNGRPALCWVSNSENDPFGRKGICSLHRAAFSGTGWTKSVLASGLKAVDQVAAQDDQIWFSADVDKDTTTLNDREIFCYDGTVTQVTNNEVADTNPRVIDGKLSYYSDGSIVVGEDVIPFTAASDDYQYLRSASGMEALVWVVDDDVRASTLYASFNDGTGWGEPIPLSGVSGNLGSLSACFRNDGTLAIVGCERGLDANNANYLSGTAALNCYTVTPYCDLAITSADYIQHTLVAGKELSLQLQVENRGMTAANIVTVEVLNGTNSLSKNAYSAQILSGNQEYLYINVPLPDPVLYTDLTVKVTAEGYAEATEADNSATVSLRLTDVSVESAQAISDGSTTTVTALVANRGQTALESFALTLYDTDGTTSLATQTVSGLAVGDSTFVTFNVNSAKANADILTVKTPVLTGENIEANNACKVVVEAQQVQTFSVNASLRESGASLTVTASVCDPTAAGQARTVLFAAYDASGKMLSAGYQALEAVSSNEFFAEATLKNAADIHKIRIFVCDGSHKPIAEAYEKQRG